ncbi:MAG: hypothetical protein B6226_06095 [Candidatus Cloacimonetes bacterium 4572_65]|nr:MAG: hypothetical protein B6226_06095 [Candidatus Cloacimonetes bacterium 4572_65]
MKKLIVVLLVIGSFYLCSAESVNSHLITKVENMIRLNDTYFITKYIESNMSYKKIGKFYEELVDTLKTNNDDFEYSVLFSRAGAISLLDKAEELKYSNRKMSNNLKQSACTILNNSIEDIYSEWLLDDNKGTYLLKNGVDMLRLSSRVQAQLFSANPISNYNNYIAFGELYLATNDYQASLEYFKVAKDICQSLETQEYALVTDYYIALAECNSHLENEGTLFNYAEFINSYQVYSDKHRAIKEFIAKKFAGEMDDVMNVLKVPNSESVERLVRFQLIHDRVFKNYEFMEIQEVEVNDSINSDN